MRDSLVVAGCNRVNQPKLFSCSAYITQIYQTPTADTTCESPCKFQLAFIRWYLMTLTFDLELGRRVDNEKYHKK